MSDGRIVIVGAGQGGMQAAMSLRKQGFEGPVTLIGDEPGLPYERPPLSKAYLKSGDADALTIRPGTYFARSRIDVRAGLRVTAIDRERRRVRCDDGSEIDYAHLILAMGARNVVPPIDGIDRLGVHALRGLDDARRLREAVAGAGRAVVIGGGFIGLEFAAVARAAGLEVTVVERTDRLMARAVSPPVSARFLDVHRAQGIEIVLGTAVAGIGGAEGGPAQSVRLADGRELAADLVLVATGVAPNCDLAEAAGLATDDGIVVDAGLHTSDPAISALGDVAAFPGPHGIHVRLESVQAATDHARHIASRLTGHRTDYAAVPWFWSDQGELKLQIAGLSQNADQRVVRPGDGPADIVLSFADDRLVAVETINQPIVHMAARKALALPDEFTRDELARNGDDLRAAVKMRG